MAESETGPTWWLRKVWDRLCELFTLIGIIVTLTIAGCEIALMVQNMKQMVKLFGVGQSPAHGYDRDGTASCGYVALTTAPKHLGGIYFVTVFQISLIIWCLIIVAADLTVFRWTSQSPNSLTTYASGTISMLHTKGIEYGESQIQSSIPPYYIIALGFLRLWLVVAYLSQSFYGIGYGGGEDGGGGGPDGRRFVLWMGFIMLGSVITSIIAQVFVAARRTRTSSAAA